MRTAARSSGRSAKGAPGRSRASRAQRFARYYNYHRLDGEIGWLTPAERFDGTPFTDRGFQNIPVLGHLAPWLADLRAAA